MKKINKNKSLYLILASLIFLILFFIFLDKLAPHDPYQGNLRLAFLPPNKINLLGTDKLGRDILSRIIYGVRISLTVSLSLVIIISFVGSLLGIIGGYFGGLIDKIIIKISDILISCPSMVLAIALAGIMGPKLQNAMIAIFVVTISKYIRLARSLVIKISHEEYIKAARVSGTKNIHILTRHILPNIIQTLIITASTDIGTMILELSALSFLGFGVTPPTPELGLMINEGRAYMLQSPGMILFPGLVLLILIGISNFISDKLRDVLD